MSCIESSSIQLNSRNLMVESAGQPSAYLLLRAAAMFVIHVYSPSDVKIPALAKNIFWLVRGFVIVGRNP